MKNNLATFLLKLAPRPLMAIKCSGLKSFARMQQWSNHAQVDSFCRGVSPEFPDQILRRASSFFSVSSDRVCHGIIPILPKNQEWPAERTRTGFRKDPVLKTILYRFGFTRDNVG